MAEAVDLESIKWKFKSSQRDCTGGIMVITLDCGPKDEGSTPFQRIFYGGYGRVVEDACLWNKYIRNTRVRIPLATPFFTPP